MILILLVTSSLMTISEKPIISICISVQLSKCSAGTQCHRVGGSACTDSVSAASIACQQLVKHVSDVERRHAVPESARQRLQRLGRELVSIFVLLY